MRLDPELLRSTSLVDAFVARRPPEILFERLVKQAHRRARRDGDHYAKATACIAAFEIDAALAERPE
jgi:hypothetical protein